MSQSTCIKQTWSSFGKPGGASSSSADGRGRPDGGRCRARRFSVCRHTTGLSVRRLVKSMARVVMMCRMAVYSLKEVSLTQPVNTVSNQARLAPEALL